MIILPTHCDLSIEQVLLDDQVIIMLRSTLLTADCPDCGTPSRRLHSHYRRKPSDLPVSGRPVRLIIEVRRFFCDKATCPRKTFVQQIPSLLGPHAQRTTRLQETLQGLGLALGGEAGARLANKLGMPAHPESLLRLVRQATPPQREPAKIIGIDDWAFKRRHRYGTLICDLEQGVPVDVLPDRDVTTVLKWLEQNPQVEVISRDRWSEYATAAQKGAPQAIQVADRWHLIQNLVKSLTDLLAQSRGQISQNISDPIAGQAAPPPTSLPTENMQALSATVQQRQDQFAQVQRLLEQKYPVAQIARQVGISQRTLYRWLEHAEVPQGRHRARRQSVIDTYKSYVRQRWAQGCQRGSQLYRELVAKGYRGSERAVYRYLAYLQASASAHLPSHLPEGVSAKQAAWLLVHKPGSLDERQQRDLAFIRQASPSVEKAYHLAQAFVQMLRGLKGYRLDSWLLEAKESGLPELLSFVEGIQRDHAAVQAGLTLPYSNGLLEGHITRLKFIKRSMYGRAQFDLLRQRVLCAS